VVNFITLVLKESFLSFNKISSIFFAALSVIELKLFSKCSLREDNKRFSTEDFSDMSNIEQDVPSEK